MQARNLILMPFAHIAIAKVVSQVLVAQEAMVDKSHLSTENKSRKVLEQSVQNIIALAKKLVTRFNLLLWQKRWKLLDY